MVLSVLLIFGVFVGFSELFYLNNRKTEKVLGVKSDNSIDLMIGTDLSQDQEINITENISSEDARPLIIKKYLEKYK